MKNTFNHQEHLRSKTQVATISHHQAPPTLCSCWPPSTVVENSLKYTKSFPFLSYT
ncbi:shikimate kinase, chloroplastic [Corchorus olitorius]|uniref:Shikimate kinase, chloroplastic n=1 Tax=Corchorus olitorius TaxID=93759 RepID=A0A1R3IXS9_9ROSI|nr:shikimate kinase, chloroplastic [Corchorus olitorius]